MLANCRVLLIVLFHTLKFYKLSLAAFHPLFLSCNVFSRQRGSTPGEEEGKIARSGSGHRERGLIKWSRQRKVFWVSSIIVQCRGLVASHELKTICSLCGLSETCSLELIGKVSCSCWADLR